ncbi:hypothetical protein BDQ17DRAFT_1325960 [Cyathus striatus]|nr:hypothetical protein BDQ17DRAFT_1325960 [Cyathus striatus]
MSNTFVQHTSTLPFFPPAISTTSNSRFPHKIPVEVFESVISKLFNVSGKYDSVLMETFKSVSLTNSEFLYCARKHSRLFSAKTFRTVSRMKKYVEFAREFPHSTILGRVEKLDVYIDEGDDSLENWEKSEVEHPGGWMYQSALSRFLTQELFPNVQELTVIGSGKVCEASIDSMPNVMTALYRTVTLPNLQRLHLSELPLPSDIFTQNEIAFRDLKLSSVTAADERGISFPRTMERLELWDASALHEACASILEEPESFAGLKELVLKGYDTAQESEAAWKIMYGLKDSLRRLALFPNLEPEAGEIHDETDISAFETLDELTAKVDLNEDAESKFNAIRWLSHVFNLFMRFPSYTPTFALRLLIRQSMGNAIDPQFLVNLAGIDEWVKNFLPQRLSVQVVIQIAEKTPMDVETEESLRIGMANCSKRKILSIERYT